MDASVVSILLSILLFLLYVLVPLIPAYIIYKNFPSTQVGASGFLGQLKINSTGAFAAYIIVVVLGSFLVIKTQDLITSSAVKRTSWHVNSRVIFKEKDANGNWIKSIELTDKDIKDKLDIRTNPNYTEKNLSQVDFITHSIDGLPKVTFSYPAFESHTIDLNNPDVEIDITNKTIKLGEITLRRSNQEYKPDTFQKKTSLTPTTLKPVFNNPRQP